MLPVAWDRLILKTTAAYLRLTFNWAPCIFVTRFGAPGLVDFALAGLSILTFAYSQDSGTG